MEPYVWKEASVTYTDFIGTAALDHRMTGESAYSTAGIDEEKWLVVGFDIGGGEHDHQLKVVAVDLENIPVDQTNVIDYLMKEHGHIPVQELMLHDVDPYKFLKQITHVFELRMRINHHSDKEIVVTGVTDIPKQH